MTLVYQIEVGCKRLRRIGKEGKEENLTRFFDWFGDERSKSLQFVCGDVWAPYFKVIAEQASQAIHLLDRFHIMAHLSIAIDEVLTSEARQIQFT